MRPETIPKQFYLLGEDAATTTQDIDVPSSISEHDLRQLLASHFAIVEPQGIGFVHGPEALPTVADVLATDAPIALTIDGHAVRDVPGPAGLPYVGNYFEVFPDHLGNHGRLFNKYGAMFQTTSLGSTVYYTNEPSLATHIFTEGPFFSKQLVPGHPLYPIKNDQAGVFLGDTATPQWRLAHQFLPPFFAPKAVRHYAPTMNATVEAAYAVFDELDARGEAFSAFSYMAKLASQAVGKLVLGMDFAHFTSVDAPPHEMLRLMTHSLELAKKVSSFGSWYASLPFGDPAALRAIKGRVEAMVGDVVKRTRAEASAKGEQEDLDLQTAALRADHMIDYLLRATDSKGRKMPTDQIWEPLTVATGAGFTTTSSLMSWALYALVSYPGVQERLLQELVDHGFDEAGTGDRLVTDEFTSQLPYLDHFIKELQRRHNPSFQPARTAQCDMVLPGGYRVPQGAVVTVALHHLHNHARIWGNPADFDPDRWDTERVKERPRNAYMPFATGQRMCIGFNFALQEVRIFVTKLVWRYHFSLASEGVVEYDPQFILLRPTNLYVRAERRVKWPPRSEISREVKSEA